MEAVRSSSSSRRSRASAPARPPDSGFPRNVRGGRTNTFSIAGRNLLKSEGFALGRRGLGGGVGPGGRPMECCAVGCGAGPPSGRVEGAGARICAVVVAAEGAGAGALRFVRGRPGGGGVRLGDADGAGGPGLRLRDARGLRRRRDPPERVPGIRALGALVLGVGRPGPGDVRAGPGPGVPGRLARLSRRFGPRCLPGRLRGLPGSRAEAGRLGLAAGRAALEGDGHRSGGGDGPPGGRMGRRPAPRRRGPRGPRSPLATRMASERSGLHRPRRACARRLPADRADRCGAGAGAPSIRSRDAPGPGCIRSGNVELLP